MTTSNSSPELLLNGTVVDSDGDAIGKVGQVYLDYQTGAPSWVTVKTGWFGTGESFVPQGAAGIDGETIRVPYSKDTIKGAPHYDVGAPLSQADEAALYSYYGLGSEEDDMEQVASTGEGIGTARGGGSGVTGAENVGSLTRSEEQLNVGTETVQTGRARLRKFVVAENQSVTVPVSHDEVRLVREPIGSGDQLEDTTIGEDAADVVLTDERVVVTKETVPVEKVRLETETVTEQQQVTEPVRKEQIEFDDDGADRPDADYGYEVASDRRRAD
jgi:uncharacterized protein (TIGR02271 family)